MSARWRIEHGDALALLGELPDGLAQCIITSPPAGDPGLVLAVLARARRVLRDDGSLCLYAPVGEASRLALALRIEGWLPVGAGDSERVLVFAKQPGFLFDHRRGELAIGGGQSPACPAGPVAQAPGRRCAKCRTPRRAWCVPASSRASELGEQTAAWCVAASTVPVACGYCGAPYQHHEPLSGGRPRWRAGCIHHDERGRCLVLDPFCTEASAAVAIAAVRRGRAFLGITPDQRAAHSVHLRLLERERRTQL